MFQVFLACLILIGCGSTSKKVDQFKKQNPQNFKTIQVDGRDLHYAESGLSQNPLVLFVHGTPGSWDAWGDFLVNEDLQKNFHIIAVDRPGFGKSSTGRSIPVLQKQSEILISILKNNKNPQKAILVGHSYGGPLVLQMALDFPELIGGIVLIASPADPDLEKIHWYQKLANLTLSRWILPTSINVCIDEIYPLKEELQKIEPRLNDLKAWVSIIHGGKDPLVPVENVDYLKSKISSDLLIDIQVEPKWNHFIPWNQPKSIDHSIYKLSDQLKTTK